MDRLRSFGDWIGSSVVGLERLVARLLFVRMLPIVAPNRVSQIKLFGSVGRLALWLAVGVGLYGLLYWKAAALNTAGLLFDFAGLARVFVGEEWDQIFEDYGDEAQYPGGPPSWLMREYFKHDNPDTLGDLDEEEEGMSKRLYWQRGLVMVLFGLTFQGLSSFAS